MDRADRKLDKRPINTNEQKAQSGDEKPGKAADVVIFDPEETYRIDKNTFASKGRNTPFDGKEVTGRVKCTICDGEVVFNELNK